MTKGQIFFSENFKHGDCIKEVIEKHGISIYLHGDGYPFHSGLCAGIFNPILTYVSAFKKMRGYFDPEYVCARLVQHLANSRDSESPMPERSYLGIGIVTEEIDHNYTYIVTNTQVICYDYDDNLIKQSKSF